MGQASRGICVFCGQVFAKGGMARHIAACGERKPGNETCFYIKAQGFYQPQYWLHVAAHPKAQLSHLDRFLRRIWLECCGHMSSFQIGEWQYLDKTAEDYEAKSMTSLLGRVLFPGLEFRHTYDFGTSTELSLRVIGEIKSAPVKDRILLLARNVAPRFECVECGKTATQLCSQCSWEGDAWLCDDCGSKHDCGEEMLLPVVNSPRVGQCGYTG